MTFISRCIGCPYGEGNAIGHRGDPASRIAMVGEAPGATEIEEGIPFVGPAGMKVLWPAIREVGLSETDVFITNAVACLPVPVRPRVAAIKACHARLAQDLGVHDRDVIVALGATAIRAVAELRGFATTKAQPGTELASDWGTVVPTFHPAFILRRGLQGPEMRRLVADLDYARRKAGFR